MLSEEGKGSFSQKIYREDLSNFIPPQKKKEAGGDRGTRNIKISWDVIQWLILRRKNCFRGKTIIGGGSCWGFFRKPPAREMRREGGTPSGRERS